MLGGTDFLQGPAGAAPLLPSELARFCWSVEYAHEDAVLALVCARDPACVLTSGLDRCVRMWSHSGSFKGVLLQGYTPGMRSPFWSLEVDVAAREARDDAEAKRVAADLMGDSDSSQTPIVVSKIEEARALDEQIQEPELSPRLAASRPLSPKSRPWARLMSTTHIVTAGVAGVVEESTDAEGVRVYFCLNWTCSRGRACSTRSR